MSESKELVEQTEYFTATDVTTTKVVRLIEPNLTKLKAEIVEYLDNNTVDGSSYRVENLHIATESGRGDYTRSIELNLQNYWIDDDDPSENELSDIDEDYTDDDAFESFLSGLSAKCKMDISIPWYYYPK